MTDPIADMLTRIRNGIMAKKTHVSVPYSKFKIDLAHKLHQLNYVEDVTVESEPTKHIIITLKYTQQHPSISHIKRVSKPGRRVYVRADKIPSPLAGFGSVIISSSKGILTGKEAKTQGIGGELICQIW